jgi:predicted TIM-barrel fold metal-dependent hydrolase
MIDVHAHFLPPSYVAALAHAGIERPDGFPRVPAWEADAALATMDALEIELALLSISSPGVGFLGPDVAVELARAVNDEGSEVVRAHPGRFGLLATLPLPDVEAALAEVARADDVLGVDGFLLMTNYDGRYLGDPCFDALMAELDRREAVVALHPTSPPGWEDVALGRPRPLLEFPLDTTRAVFNLVLTGTLQRHPRIRFVVPHAGAAVPALADRVAGLGGVLSEAPIDVEGALGTLWFDLAGGPYPRSLPPLLALAGHERLLYGSDVPFSPPQLVRAAAADLAGTSALEDGQRRAVLRENARRLFPRLGSP